MNDHYKKYRLHRSLLLCLKSGLGARQSNIVPAGLLSRHNLNLEGIIHPESGASGMGFFAELFEQLHHDIQTNLTSLQGKDVNSLLFSTTMLKILSATCWEYQSVPVPITHTCISLIPLRKLWIAWKTTRRIRR